MYVFCRYNLVGERVDTFRVDPDTGLVRTAAVLDREESSVYYLTLVARDSSLTDPKATAVNLTITVTDQNDNAPVFTTSSYTVHIRDGTQPGMIYYSILAVKHFS
jgi:protocadherin Fat 4